MLPAHTHNDIKHTNKPRVYKHIKATACRSQWTLPRMHEFMPPLFFPLSGECERVDVSWMEQLVTLYPAGINSHQPRSGLRVSCLISCQREAEGYRKGVRAESWPDTTRSLSFCLLSPHTHNTIHDSWLLLTLVLCDYCFSTFWRAFTGVCKSFIPWAGF